MKHVNSLAEFGTGQFVWSFIWFSLFFIWFSWVKAGHVVATDREPVAYVARYLCDGRPVLP